MKLKFRDFVPFLDESEKGEEWANFFGKSADRSIVVW